MSASVPGFSAVIASKIDRSVQLRRSEIQGDVLIGLQKDVEFFIFFRIEDADAFKRVVRDHLADLVTTTEAVRSRELQIAAAKEAGDLERLPFVGFNLGFTHQGLGALVGEGGADGMDPSFMAGAAARAADLNDPAGQDGTLAWKPGFADGGIDGVFLLTGPLDCKDAVHPLLVEKRDDVLALAGGSISIVHEETGRVRPERGHEHFGFRDGISNPGVRGLTPNQNPADGDQGAPGQDLLWPGEFVFGYPVQDPEKPFTEPGDPPGLPQAWMRDGSYMVFRRLKQLVPEFDAFLDERGEALGLDPALLGARMVGRWKSGAPVMIAPLQDEPAIGGAPLLNNDFEFGSDPHQRRCPYAAHIRKTYPRDDLARLIPNGEGVVQTHRIMRAGIPFGPEVTEAEAESGTSAAERGLLFVCYQTSIVEQFEFIQKDWSNAPGFLFDQTRPGSDEAVEPGHDPIIGQASGAREMDEPVPNYPFGSRRSTLAMPNPFVVPDAAAYFFMPSIFALRTALSEPGPATVTASAERKGRAEART
ncbi:Dyp-type peroxidase [Methylobacterium oryzihabitans]|uniref:Dyp-type peroxidase n=1 Tax=Methylobacterium oryzihabitans TaxID=2499852 RepID=A0A3S2VC82_9HYPH|nr:Dyp-type peroxidase [Methylobacterium oryzihabitans]RVU21052.1 Dyp-type peroxidase [Methylobacterium oryzihabitans]